MWTLLHDYCKKTRDLNIYDFKVSKCVRYDKINNFGKFYLSF